MNKLNKYINCIKKVFPISSWLGHRRQSVRQAVSQSFSLSVIQSVDSLSTDRSSCWPSVNFIRCCCSWPHRKGKQQQQLRTALCEFSVCFSFSYFFSSHFRSALMANWREPGQLQRALFVNSDNTQTREHMAGTVTMRQRGEGQTGRQA